MLNLQAPDPHQSGACLRSSLLLTSSVVEDDARKPLFHNSTPLHILDAEGVHLEEKLKGFVV
jgi:hypothetical protein